MATFDAEVARRFVACSGWRWTPGMEGRTAGGYYSLQIVAVGYSEDQELRGVDSTLSEEPRGEPIAYVSDGDILRDCDGHWEDDGRGALPDMSRPATQGCALELVREALGVPMVDVFEMLRPAMGRGVPFAEALVDLFERACATLVPVFCGADEGQ